MSLSEFFPVYPDIDQENFEAKLNQKMEFLELVPDEENAKKGDIMLSNKLFLHQELVKRYLEPFTGYERVILNHEVGVGKTRSAIGVAENYLKHYNMSKAYIFAKNDTVTRNFQAELFRMGLYKTKDESEYEKMTEKGVSISRTRSISPYYSFHTFEAFVNEQDIKANSMIQNKISLKMTQGEDEDAVEESLSQDEKNLLSKMRARYNGSVIIFDEVHNLGVTSFEPIRDSNIKEKDLSQYQYRRFWAFLKTIKHAKVVLLSATIMVDSPIKIASIMNLILPRDNQISYEETKKVIKTLDQPKIDKFLCPYFKGRISYLKQSGRVANQIFMGQDVDFEMDGKRITNRLVLDFMEPTQASAYIKVIAKKSDNDNVFHHDLRQVSNFAVYKHPDMNIYTNKAYDNEEQDEDEIDVDDENNIENVDILIPKIDESFEYAPQQILANIMKPEKKMELRPAYTEFYSNVADFGPNGITAFTSIQSLPIEQQAYFLSVFFSDKAILASPTNESLNPLIKKMNRMSDEEKKKVYSTIKKQQRFVMRPDLATKNIRKSSCKIASVIYDVLVNLQQERDKQECLFVYSHYKAYGAYLVGALLQALGFQRFTGKISKEEKLTLPDNESSLDSIYPFRFATITDSKDAVESIVNVFNNSKNKNGHYLKIVVGSPKSSESISFLNVRGIHILEPSWNDQDTIQAIGRGVRANSHQAFKSQEEKYVKIYVHVAMTRRKNNTLEMNMIDMNASRISAEKSFKIGLVQNTIKKCSFDKNLNAWRNGLVQDEIETIDYSTYRLYYKQEFLHLFLARLQPLFYENSSYPIELVAKHTGTSISDINSMIEILQQYSLQDRYGMQNYIQFDGKNIFLLPYKVSNNKFLSYYSSVINMEMDTNTAYFIEENKMYNSFITESMDLLEETPNKDVVALLRNKEKMQFKIKLFLLEHILTQKDRSENQKTFLEFFKYRWFAILQNGKKKFVHTLYFIPETNHFSCVKHKFDSKSTKKGVELDRKLRILDGSWRYATQQEEDEILPIINDNLAIVANKYKPHPYYGIICTTDGDFRLVDNRNLEKSDDCRRHHRGVSFTSILKECAIDDLYSVWSDLVKYFPNDKNIQSAPKDENSFKKHMSGYSNQELSFIFETYMTRKDIVWLY